MTFTTPSEIDTEIARLHFELSKAEAIIARYENADDEWIKSRLEADYENAIDRAADLHVELAPLAAQYNAERWPRYWHVSNNNGHIHNSLHCTSCFYDTQYSWRTDLSGLTEEEVVEFETYNVCSVCMPIAPAEQKAARVAYNKAQREAKAAERQAKKDAKAVKARERAVKLVDKVQAEIEKMGGIKVFAEDYSLYGKDGRKSLYDATFDMQQTVGDVLYEMKDRQESGHSHYSMNEHVKAELEKRGLVI